MEIISAIIHQLTRNLSPEEIMRQGFADYYVDHTTGVWPQSAGGIPFTATFFQSKGDPITDLTEDMAAEQKARTTYDNILRLVDDPDILDPIRFLREREIVHFQRFGETLRRVQDRLDDKNFYAFNPAFDSRPDRAENDVSPYCTACEAHDAPAPDVRRNAARCTGADEAVRSAERELPRKQPTEGASPSRIILNGNTGRRIHSASPCDRA